MIKRSLCVAIALLFIIVSFPSCKATVTKKQVTYTDYFDTAATLTAYTDTDTFSKMCEIAVNVMSKYHKLLDIYNEYEGICNLKTINDKAPEIQTVSQELLDFLIWAKEAHALTHGQTNILLGSVTRLWHIARTDTKIPPEKDALEEANKHTDLSLLLIDEKEMTVALTDPEASLDAGALAKGYVADILCDELTSAGYTNFLINLGGNVKSVGMRSKNTPWSIGIENPRDPTSSQFSIELTNASLVTSGSYHRYFDYEGKRFHHIIDPDTLYPKNEYLSVSVMCESSALADLLSTALFNMNYEEGLALVNGIGGVDVLWIYSDSQKFVSCTDGFEKYVFMKYDRGY